MTDSPAINPVPVGLDDGYAYTKVALPDGRLTVIPSSARVGASGVTWIHQGQQRIFEYETEGTRYSVGAVDGEPTHFEGYPYSGMNRAIVQHALQQAGLGGHSLHAVSGLPVSAFYLRDGSQRHKTLEKKRTSLKQSAQPIDGRLPAAIAFHEVIPEALAAWYDYVIVEQKGSAALDETCLSVPIAIVDIGGRTTDFVVVKDQGVVHGASGSLQCGMLDVKQQVANGIQERFDLETLGEQRVAQAVEKQSVRLHGKDYDIGPLVRSAKQQVVERIHAETRRQLGLGVELDRILFVGGGTVALAEDIANWFPNQAVAEHLPASPPGRAQKRGVWMPFS
jgi:plasmid segregation protein ParM